MDIVQSFYDNLASQYEKLFSSWHEAVKEQAVILDRLFKENGYNEKSTVLDCACGIGTQAIGLADLGYNITASDISEGALTEARKRAENSGANIDFVNADFRTLPKTFSKQFDTIIAMDNAIVHMLTKDGLKAAIRSISDILAEGGIFVASIRDYDSLLESKPPYSAPYIHKTQNGQRVCFQTWDWNGGNYKLTQYIIEDDNSLKTSKFECEYRAVRREELSSMLISNGFCSAEWKFPEETGFYQPIVVAKK